jgi:hypothetical protein
VLRMGLENEDGAGYYHFVIDRADGGKAFVNAFSVPNGPNGWPPNPRTVIEYYLPDYGGLGVRCGLSSHRIERLEEVEKEATKRIHESVIDWVNAEGTLQRKKV